MDIYEGWSSTTPAQEGRMASRSGLRQVLAEVSRKLGMKTDAFALHCDAAEDGIATAKRRIVRRRG